MKPFLDCNIWSVYPIEDGYFLVESIYKYCSLDETIKENHPECIALPESLIENMEILDKLDVGFINQNQIPILKREITKTSDRWFIDLTNYDKHINI